jgi:hydroxymethylbilane synthase
MKRRFNVVCRGSWLSLAQAELFKKKLLTVAPQLEIETIVKETEGDRNQDAVLQDLEGKDFFTQDIQNFLKSGQADFAVHSLKDVSGENFFSGTHYAIFEREDPRDVVVFNSDVPDKLKDGKPLTIGTSSPRRVLMATRFLSKALPFFNEREALIEAKPIRGNVDTRLRKLNDHQFDGIILAAAGLNRLLKFGPSQKEVSQLLKGKRLMVLPLLECPPAPGQGAIVAETTSHNIETIQLLQQINVPALAEAAQREREFARQYGKGCHQQFGVIHLGEGSKAFTFGAGLYTKANGELTPFKEFKGADPARQPSAKSSASIAGKPEAKAKGVFVASEEIHSVTLLEGKKIWTVDSAGWFSLAKQGHWVEGCADGLGLEFILPWLNSPLIHLSKSDIQIAM